MMLEIPETATIGAQAAEMLAGKTVLDVIPATSPHKFAWYNGDPENYPELFVGRTVTGAAGHGAFVTIRFDKDTHLTVGDGTDLKYGWPEEPRPAKHQLLIEFADGSFLAFTVAMYGAIYAYEGEFDNPYCRGSLEKPLPLEAGFDRAYFDALRAAAKPNLSAKAFLATEQRIPGLGNGTLQDILFRAKIHPGRKIATLSGVQWTTLFDLVKTTLSEMTDLGGRDTEKDFFGTYGAYRTILSKNTWKDPCPVCGGAIVKEACLGGAVYYCPTCQPLS
jgi:formamidopyrimidine-DNA glycosylase